MRPGGLLKWLGLTVFVVGLGVGVASAMGSCGTGLDEGQQAGAPEAGQVIAQPELPSLDLKAPQAFQTASFAFG